MRFCSEQRCAAGIATLNSVAPGPLPTRKRADADAAALRDRLDDIERGLVLGTGEASIPGLDEIALVASTTMHRVQHGNRRVVASRTIDDRLVIAAFQGIPSPNSTDSEWLPIWERVLRETLATSTG